jgi:GNAT superfamily N-acetyltransferase
MEPQIEIRHGEDPDALALVAAMEDEVVSRYGPVRSERTSLVDAGELAPPGGAFVVLTVDGRAVAGGGVRRLEEGVAEIKRMYVLPEARGQGLGRTLLRALEAAAAELGYDRVRLDTVVELAAALALYRGAGYEPIPNYNGNAYASFWGEKRL